MKKEREDFFVYFFSMMIIFYFFQPLMIADKSLAFYNLTFYSWLLPIVAFFFLSLNSAFSLIRKNDRILGWSAVVVLFVLAATIVFGYLAGRFLY